MSINAIEDKIADVGRRISRLLAQDAGYFFRQTVRTEFGEHPEVADGLSDDALAALKGEAYDAAKAASEHVASTLDDTALWLTGEPGDNLKAPVKDISGVAEVMSEIEKRITAFLSSHSLSPAEPVSWRLPARFIDGEHLPTLTETYWKHMIRRAELVAVARAKAEAQSAADRLRRWDEA
ncbi:MAG: hypothetical protein ACE366_01320 [Bradymonadia bacterium]